jgi:hypothetical protein
MWIGQILNMYIKPLSIAVWRFPSLLIDVYYRYFIVYLLCLVQRSEYHVQEGAHVCSPFFYCAPRVR